VRHLTRRRTIAWLAGILVSAAFVLLAVGWVAPTSSFLFLPHQAQPLAEKVTVEGAKPVDDEGGIYYVDVTVRRASWLERLLSFVRPDGSTLVPEHELVQPGSSFEERRKASLAEMARSEQVAAAVALRAAGLEVGTEPRGVIVEGIDPAAPGAKTLRVGDVIVEAAGRPTRTPGALRDAVGSVDPGDSVALVVRRDGARRNLVVRTVPAPGEPERPIIGIRITQAAEIDLPIDVDIDLGDVGGPSAGLPFALSVLQELGTDVDRGYRVAATGEIELDGTVIPIGGMKQKVLGVKKAGADVFLVPSGGDNATVARRYAGKLRVIAVDNFQQALRALETLPRKG
jgi:PDZ domain-containing protein